MAEHTRALADLRRGDEAAFGGKSASLGELLSAGIPVPPGFALAASAYHEFIEENGLEGRLAQDDPAALRAAMREAPMPAGVRDEVLGRYGELAEAPVAVRSSAIGEDSAEATFAGQQETYLWVRGAEAVCEAVRDCWISLYSPTAVSYRARLEHAPEPAMGVTIQRMVDAEVSGVMFTCNPVSGDPSMVAINASWGLGLAVVGGEVTPDDFLVSKVTREVVREQIQCKDVEYVPDPSGAGAMQREVDPDRRNAATLDRPALTAMVDLARRVQAHFGSHQDIEWVIERGTPPPEGLFVVQSRPVTGLRKPAAAPTDAMSLVMSTFGAGGAPRSA